MTNIEKRYYFRRKGVLDNNWYDWIGEPRFGLYPVELNGKLGFVDEEGEIVIPIIYDKKEHQKVNNEETIFWGTQEYLNLSKNKLFGLIRCDGTIAVDFQWHKIKIWDLKEDMLPVENKEKWGFVNVKTKAIVPPIYDEVLPFMDGFAPVSFNGKWGGIDINGNIILEPKYLLPSYFHGEFAIVYEGGYICRPNWNKMARDSNCKIVNRKGYEVISDYSWIQRLGNNVFTLEKAGIEEKIKLQLLAFPSYIVVIDGGIYDNKQQYIGGGRISVVDYYGRNIKISNKELKECLKKAN